MALESADEGPREECDGGRSEPGLQGREPLQRTGIAECEECELVADGAADGEEGEEGTESSPAVDARAPAGNTGALDVCRGGREFADVGGEEEPAQCRAHEENWPRPRGRSDFAAEDRVRDKGCRDGHDEHGRDRRSER